MEFRVVILFAAATAAGAWYAVTALELVQEYGNFIFGEEERCHGYRGYYCSFWNSITRWTVIRARDLALEVVAAQFLTAVFGARFIFIHAIPGAILVFGAPLLGLAVLFITIFGIFGLFKDPSFLIIGIFTVVIAACAAASAAAGYWINVRIEDYLDA
jgi:hypothetical protein